jgi:uncharacterized protein (UPF0335 family)
MSEKYKKIIEEYVDRIADLLINKDILNQTFQTVYAEGRKDGFDAQQKVNSVKDILGMTIEEYLYKHSEEIAEEVLNNNPLLKETKDGLDG